VAPPIIKSLALGSARPRLLQKLDEPPPSGHARWDGSCSAKPWEPPQTGSGSSRGNSGSVSNGDAVGVFPPTRSLPKKTADVVGLYLATPENAVVLSFDEKLCIQALERAQGWLKMPNGRALTRFAHEYKRHGTSTLFAALDVATGQVIGGHFQRKRRSEFLGFLDRLVALHPGKDLHVILDHLSTHKVEQGAWASAHPQVHFHFTPTHASWLNQIEVWFSILSVKSLRGASFRSVKQLVEYIDAFIVAYNAKAAPFE
jgi:transposase